MKNNSYIRRKNIQSIKANLNLEAILHAMNNTVAYNWIQLKSIEPMILDDLIANEKKIFTY